MDQIFSLSYPFGENIISNFNALDFLRLLSKPVCKAWKNDLKGIFYWKVVFKQSQNFAKSFFHDQETLTIAMCSMQDVWLDFFEKSMNSELGVKIVIYHFAYFLLHEMEQQFWQPMMFHTEDKWSRDEMLFWAVKRGDVEFLQSLVDISPRIISKTLDNCENDCLLTHSLNSRQYKVAKMLIEKASIEILMESNKGQEALVIAAHDAGASRNSFQQPFDMDFLNINETILKILIDKVPLESLTKSNNDRGSALDQILDHVNCQIPPRRVDFENGRGQERSKKLKSGK